MTILYITRKFPPSIGGMQTQSKEFYDTISRRNRVFLIAWGHSQAFLPFFLVYAFLRAIVILSTKEVEIIQLGDMVLSPLGLLLKILSGKPVLTITHGRDAAYHNMLYDSLIMGSARRLDRIICVSRSNMKRLADRGVPEEKMSVIPNGIDIKSAGNQMPDREYSSDFISKRFNIELKGKKIILSMSRLVPKKGIREFTEYVLPKISEKKENTLFIIAGDGPEKEKIDEIVNRLGLQGRVYLTGKIEHDSLVYKALFSVSSVFVMPNVRVDGDAEGFGVAALEAGLNGVPVVAYDVDGISEAVHNDENGILIKADEAGLFSDTICNFLRDDTLRQNFADKAKEYVTAKFCWDRIIDMYKKEYLKLLKNSLL